MHWDAKDWAVIIGALFGGAAIPKFMRGLWEWFTGRMRLQRAEVDRLQDQVEDVEAKNRRLIETLHEMRVVALKHGIPSDELPNFPA